MDERISSVFNDSLERCTNDPRFLERFYEIFLHSDPGIAARFAHTDFKRQTKMLRRSLYIVMLAGLGEAGALEEIERLATLHDRHHNDISASFYELWLDSLTQAVDETDKQATPVTLEIWRTVMRTGIALMLERY